MALRYRRALWIGAALVPTAIIAWLVRAAVTATLVDTLLTAPAYARTATPAPLALRPGELSDLLARDPLALARRGLRRYREQIRDYRCVLLKQERVEGRLGPLEKIEVRYRESPTSVYMIWRENAGQVRRALFIDNQSFLDPHNRKIARVEPNGAILRLFVGQVDIPIHGPQARSASRRSMDEFGFKSTFELLRRFNDLARKNGVLDIRFGGQGVVDGRPTYVLVRQLPYQGPQGPYPDALMILHLDQEWLLPTAVYSYADHAGKVLLGSYVFTQVELNPGLSDADFRF